MQNLVDGLMIVSSHYWCQIPKLSNGSLFTCFHSSTFPGGIGLFRPPPYPAPPRSLPRRWLRPGRWRHERCTNRNQTRRSGGKSRSGEWHQAGKNKIVSHHTQGCFFDFEDLTQTEFPTLGHPGAITHVKMSQESQISLCFHKFYYITLSFFAPNRVFWGRPWGFL